MALKQKDSNIIKNFETSSAQMQKLKEDIKAELRNYLQKLLEDYFLEIDQKFKEMEKEMLDFKDKAEKQRRDMELVKDTIPQILGHSIQMEERLEELDQVNLDLQRKIEEVQKNQNLNLENKTDDVQAKVDRLDEEMVILQYRSMEYAIRVRGLRESKQENLKEIFTQAFAEIEGVEPEDFEVNIEKIYRVNSWVAKQKRLARDVVIYFTTKKIRYRILQAFYKNKFQILGQNIIMMKEIPPKMLKKRKEFAFLVEELRKHQIYYRWEVPVGLTLNYKGRRYFLNTVFKARDFYTNVLKIGNPLFLDAKLIGVEMAENVGRRQGNGMNTCG